MPVVLQYSVRKSDAAKRGSKPKHCENQSFKGVQVCNMNTSLRMEFLNNNNN